MTVRVRLSTAAANVSLSEPAVREMFGLSVFPSVWLSVSDIFGTSKSQLA